MDLHELDLPSVVGVWVVLMMVHCYFADIAVKDSNRNTP